MATKIDLSYKIEKKEDREIIILTNKNLLDSVAKEWAEAINKTKKTQARNFYDRVLQLEKEIDDNGKEHGFESVYPFIKMLNSKVAYGVSRKVVSNEFQEMMSECLEQIKLDDNGKQTFQHFKLFFEAVLGFFKGSN